MISVKDEEKILSILEKISESIDLIKTQQKEHGEILSSLTKAAEFHKADIDKLTIEVAHISEEMKTGFEKINERLVIIEEDNKSLQEITGEHEISIRSLRRKVV